MADQTGEGRTGEVVSFPLGRSGGVSHLATPAGSFKSYLPGAPLRVVFEGTLPAVFQCRGFVMVLHLWGVLRGPGSCSHP